MAAGGILKEQLLVIEEYTVKLNEDIEKGEIVYNDGNGILAAPNTVTGPFMMALEAHDYSEETTHKITCVQMGCVEVQKVSGSGGGKKGQAVMISATAGEVTLFVKGDAPAAYAEADMQTALDTNIAIVGTLREDAADTDTSAKIWLGMK
jgi:hypothetical protein